MKYTIEEIEAMLSKITQEGWYSRTMPSSNQIVIAALSCIDKLIAVIPGLSRVDDAKFIAASPTIVKELLEENKMLNLRIKRIKLTADEETDDDSCNNHSGIDDYGLCLTCGKNIGPYDE